MLWCTWHSMNFLHVIKNILGSSNISVKMWLEILNIKCSIRNFFCHKYSFMALERFSVLIRFNQASGTASKTKLIMTILNPWIIGSQTHGKLLLWSFQGSRVENHTSIQSHIQRRNYCRILLYRYIEFIDIVNCSHSCVSSWKVVTGIYYLQCSILNFLLIS